MNESNSTAAEQIERLQKIQDVPESGRFELAIRKMDFCHRQFAAQTPNENLHQINLSLPICADYLEELIEYFGSTKESICGRIYPSLFGIISNKIDDSFYQPVIDEDQWQSEEEEAFPREETKCSPKAEDGKALSATDERRHSIGWKHSKLVYDLFVLVIESDKFRATEAKDFIDQTFVRRLISNLAICPAIEERHFLARILRRIYVKFVRFRPHIRKHLTYTLEEAVFDEEFQLMTTKTFHGIAEILDIFENIINGFKVPLKSEEQQMLVKVLIPLHKINSLEQFYKLLICRVLQLLDLCPQLTPAVIFKMLKLWPKTNGQKECIFLEEMELILEKVDDHHILSQGMVVEKFFSQLAKCISSQHFQVSLKALNFRKNRRILQLIRQSSAQFVNIAFEPLEQTAKTHWSTKIQAEARDFQNILMEMNWSAYSKRKNREMVGEEAIGGPHNPSETMPK